MLFYYFEANELYDLNKATICHARHPKKYEGQIIDSKRSPDVGTRVNKFIIHDNLI